MLLICLGPSQQGYGTGQRVSQSLGVSLALFCFFCSNSNTAKPGLTRDTCSRFNFLSLSLSFTLSLSLSPSFSDLISLSLSLSLSYERVDEIIWVKTNQLQRIIRTGRTGHWLNHGKEHCLVSVCGWCSMVCVCVVFCCVCVCVILHYVCVWL